MSILIIYMPKMVLGVREKKSEKDVLKRDKFFAL